MKKHSFTLAETLVTLTILGIIMAIVMPLINKAKPDKDIIIFKKGLYTIQSAVGNATEVLINQGALSNEIWKQPTDATRPNIVINNPTDDGVDGFCKRIADHLNTSYENCSEDDKSGTWVTNGSYENPQIITTDGIRFWNLPTGNINGTADICFDRSFTTKELVTLDAVRGSHGGGVCDEATNKAIGLKVSVRWDGKVFIPSTDTSTDANYASEFEYEQELVKRSFEVQKQD